LAAGPRLRAYLALERAMVDLDDAGDPFGDELRDRMDPIWLMLSQDDLDALDQRTGDPSSFAGTIPRRDLTVRSQVRDLFRSAA
jgi:hypothetical protein